MNSENHHSSAKSLGLPPILFFLQPSPHWELFIEEDAFEAKCTYDEDLQMNFTENGLPLWAALSKTPPTSIHTLGKTRPGGYSRSGKLLPSKFIPGKTDKRAGK